MKVVTGISEHSGWAELVTLGVRRGAPVVLERRRCELVGRGLPQNPYHHEGLALPFEQAREIVERVRGSVAEHCREVLVQLQRGLGVEAIVLRESPSAELPESLAEVLASHPLTCAADGMMYREALAGQAQALGLSVERYARRSDQVAAAAEVLGISQARLTTMIAALGRSVGTPWRKEHRVAAASALRVLALRGSLTVGR